ncbi:MAG: patatin-like phospholipase family protein [Erythrobacter sp.]|uniref:patatin-like phospholipase family protein n=1 Tax=Erythrobacter sp. TaxID=1042 RepID=UPI002624AD27|nr:patatin-like phospholipase family protein [Erythrobacter sp.]MDJ0979300.1 patatin-like phospholipase family protein [Erythrobacter sp.]
MIRLSRAFLAVLLTVALSACVSTLERPEITADDQAAARVNGYGAVRLWKDAELPEWTAWREAMFAQRVQAGAPGQFEMLSISSGSDKGAFSAGFLNGWSEAGTRPRFDIVSGVSTGALIAPFAFLGQDYDPQLRELYTTISAKMIYRSTALKGLLGGPSLASTEPLVELIEGYATKEMIDAVAGEHAMGRRLLVQTTNLDAERGVVWDLGAIAASENPARYRLFRQILLASASIPGLFPPVMIDVDSEGFAFAELHVDGGTTSSVLAIPPAVLINGKAGVEDRPGRITVLYNGALEPVYRTTKPTTFSILTRALTTSLKTADQRTLASLENYAETNGLILSIHNVGAEAEDPEAEMFDQAYMQKLFEVGRQRALNLPE